MTDLQPLGEDERAELIAYLDGEADKRSAQEIEAKLNRDPRLRAEADALKKTWQLLDFLPQPEPSASFTNRTLTRVAATIPAQAARPSSGSWMPLLLGAGWAAALMVAVLIGYATGPLFSRAKPPADRIAPATGPTPDMEEQLVRDLRLIQHFHAYQNGNDIYFAHELDRPEYFGEDRPGR